MYKEYLNLAKGIGVVLVVAGHSLFPLHIAIDIFHMPLFFILAGITYKKPQNIGEFMLSKCERILIPLFFFEIISCFIASFLAPVGLGVFNSPLWFLSTIFISLVIYLFVDLLFKGTKKHILIIIFTLISFYLAKIESKLLLDIDLSLCSVGFIHIGTLIRDCYFASTRKQLWSSLFLFLFLFVIGLFFSIEYGASGAYVFRLYKYSYFLFWFTALSGSFCVLAFSKILNNIIIFNFLGMHSLIIMCVHFPFIERLNHFFAQTDFYYKGDVLNKVVIGVGIYSIVLFISFLFIIFFKNYLPQLTGYKQILSRNNC